MVRIRRTLVLGAMTAALAASCDRTPPAPEPVPDQQLAEKQAELCRFATGGNVERVRTLLGEGAQVNERAPSGLTPLNAAIRGGKIPVIRLLIAEGADPNLPSVFTAAQAEELIRSGRRPLVTPLGNAAATGQRGTVALLLQMGADPNALDDGKTPLSLALAGRDRRVVVLLQEAGGHG